MNDRPDYIPSVRLADYDYELPEERIACTPLADRSESRLLVCNALDGSIAHCRFTCLIDLIPSGATIALNDTRVVRARLLLEKESGGKVEILLIDPVEPSPDPAISLAARGEAVWRCMVGGLKKLRSGGVVRAPILTAHPGGPGEEGVLSAEVEELRDDGVLVRFTWKPEHLAFAEVIERIGHVPLPPYIRRDDTPEDTSSYQTVYAEHDGAVAAPTAGLHFTPAMLDALERKDVEILRVTLHVGAGTFAPVKGDRADEHAMHAERIAVSRAALARLLDAAVRRETTGAPLVVVGTTSLRTLESLYWFGVRLKRNEIDPESSEIAVAQWDPYRIEHEAPELPSLPDALREVVSWSSERGLESLSGVTRLMILPGYRFHACDALVTNFHQPGSTLVLLVAAFLGGDLWRRAYDAALAEGYRFLSYGDSSMLIGKNSVMAR